MDIDVSGWILEFLLRQTSLDDQTLNHLIHLLPLPNNNPRLKKTLILRKIESHIAKSTISERTIDLLEQIQQLDHSSGITEVSQLMKSAYSTLAIHYTAKLIQQSANNNNQNHASTVKRIWSARISEMEKCGVGLAQDELVRWVRDRALDTDACEKVLERFKESDVLKTVGRYVNEAKEKMGPSFLEVACETVLNDDALSEAFGLDDVAEFRRAATDEALKVNVPRVHKHVASKRRRGAKLVDEMETCDYIPSPEVSKVQEALESSCFELHAAVKDPLPDALRLAESLKASTSGNITSGSDKGPDLVRDGKESGENEGRDNDKGQSLSHDRKGKALEANGDDGIVKDQNRRMKPSLFERNNTAHTTEWSDSIESSEDRSPTRPHLPSPQKRKVSPLSLYKMEKLVRQRKKKRWTTLEEDTLRTGVQKYGKGNWKLILSMYRDIFEDRTEVDLKDKWRNLTR